MAERNQHLRTSALVMRVVGWGMIVGGPILLIAYPPGMVWGELPAGFPLLGPPHPVSPHDGMHPYLFMIFSLYVAWAILLIRGAKDPRAAASLFDWGILANLLHAPLVGLICIQPAKLAFHFRRGLQSHGDLLVGGDIYVLDLFCDRVGRLRAKITNQRDNDNGPGDQQPPQRQPAAPA